MKNLVLLLALLPVYASADVVFCFRESGETRTFFRFEHENLVDSEFVQDELEDRGILRKTIATATVIVDLETNLVILDRRLESKLHKVIPASKREVFNGLSTSLAEDINEYAELFED